MHRLYVLLALATACGSGKGGSGTGDEVLPLGDADCRVECEVFAEVVVSISEGGDPDAAVTLAEVKQQCQEFPIRTTCEECWRQIELWLNDVHHIASDCACYFEDLQESHSDWCDELIDEDYGGSQAALAEECQTCPSAD